MENFEECSPSECKDSDGNWTKWVKERMTSEQEPVFEEVVRTLEGMGMGHLSENHILRFCDSLQWVHADIIDYITKAEEVRSQMDCRIFEEGEFDDILAMKAFNVTGAMDKVGRPIYILRIENFDPSQISEKQLVRFFCWQLDKIAVSMKPNVD